MPIKPRTRKAASPKADAAAPAATGKKLVSVAAVDVAATAGGKATKVLRDGYLEVPAGRLASVVTYLEMNERPELAPVDHALSMRYRMRHVDEPDLVWYRDLFRSVGERWLWFSRLRLKDNDLKKIIHDPRVGVFALSSLRLDGKWVDKGLLELDARKDGEVEITFFGVTPELIGRGAGPFMMRFALEQAWGGEGIQRVHLHTCSLDHPRALSFYLRHGFRAWKRGVEISADPRIAGDVAQDASPDVPLINT